MIEASPTSGSLITARHAVAAGRVVMACPGDATRRSAQGSNRLIADGAFLVQSAEDALAALAQDLRREGEALGLPAAQNADEAAENPGQLEFEFEAAPSLAPPPASDPLTRDLLAMIAEEPQPVDLLLDRAGEQGHAPSAVLERLLRLEMDGVVRQMPGRLYALTRRGAGAREAGRPAS